MTLQALQRIVWRLSNSGWCRYWVHFNYPNYPVLMAIQILDVDREGRLSPRMIYELEDLGFQIEGKYRTPERCIYTVLRTDDDGSSYVSIL